MRRRLIHDPTNPEGGRLAAMSLLFCGSDVPIAGPILGAQPHRKCPLLARAGTEDILAPVSSASAERDRYE
jgi:hypothetical protein